MAAIEEIGFMREFVAVTKALSCEKRLRILMALRGQELCEGVICQLVGLAPATTSRHLWLLRQAGLVDSEKTGRCVCYRLAEASRASMAGRTLRWLAACLALDPRVVEDSRQVRVLSHSSPVQKECCQRRERLAQKWSKSGMCLRGKGATKKVGW